MPERSYHTRIKTRTVLPTTNTFNKPNRTYKTQKHMHFNALTDYASYLEIKAAKKPYMSKGLRAAMIS